MRTDRVERPLSRPAAGGAEEDRGRLRGLRRMQRVATSLLVLAAVVFVAARLAEADHGWAGYVRATAEAAMVGALADWFAVTALFRHPLGLPVPHTAIIPTRKDQIGESLGEFVEENFLDPALLGERLRDARPARRAGTWLAHGGGARLVAEQAGALLHGLTEVLDDDLVQDGIEQVVVRRLRTVEVAPLLGRGVEFLVEGGHHRQLLESGLVGVGRFLNENRSTFRQRLSRESPWWVPESVDDRIFDKIYAALNRFIDDVGHDPEHPLRADVDARIRELAERLRTSPELRRRGEELKEELLAHPEVRAWTSSLWASTKAELIAAAEDPGSELRIRLGQALEAAGRRLEQDRELQQRVDGWIVSAVAHVSGQFRGEAADLIATTVQRWDAGDTSRRIEVQVGRDLQFIRINGTIVGGLAGLAIHTASELLL